MSVATQVQRESRGIPCSLSTYVPECSALETSIPPQFRLAVDSTIDAASFRPVSYACGDGNGILISRRSRPHSRLIQARISIPSGACRRSKLVRMSSNWADMTISSACIASALSTIVSLRAALGSCLASPVIESGHQLCSRGLGALLLSWTGWLRPRATTEESDMSSPQCRCQLCGVSEGWSGPVLVSGSVGQWVSRSVMAIGVAEAEHGEPRTNEDGCEDVTGVDTRRDIVDFVTPSVSHASSFPRTDSFGFGRPEIMMMNLPSAMLKERGPGGPVIP